MLSETELWTTVIRRQVYNMIGLATLFALFGGGLLYWQNTVSMGLQAQANDYHLASTTHYLKASDELYKLIIASSDELSQPNRPPENVGTNNRSSLYIIRQEVDFGRKLQAQYSGAQFDFLLNTLETNLSKLGGGIGSSLGAIGERAALRSYLNSTQKNLSQLARLHSIARDDLLDKIQYQKKRQTTFFSLLALTLLLAAVVITRRGLSAIQSAIDERVRYEEEKSVIEQQLRRSQKMDAVGQLTGGIAHDFNNILGIIIGNASLLKIKVSSEGQSLKYVEAIEVASRRAADVTRQLLGFSRQHATEVVAIDINTAIASMDILTTLTMSPAIEVSQNLTKELWLTDINFGDLQDALLNLVINARDAMPDGGRLAIETRNMVLDEAYCVQNPGLTAGEYVQLSISDTGVGISAELQERIFEPFFTTKEMGKGTGLGLAMVFGFVERSQGHIKVYSESGVGTTFHVYLPRSVAVAESNSLAKQEPQRLPRGDETILVVDDEPGLVLVAQETLEALGYSVLTAGNANEALEQLAAEPSIAVLFSDVVMPGGMNGYELAEQAAKQRPELKVLLTSGFTKTAVAHNGQARFDANLLNKPYTQTELALQIRARLDQTE